MKVILLILLLPYLIKSQSYNCTRIYLKDSLIKNRCFEASFDTLKSQLINFAVCPDE